jgi:benzoyl-CoA reductase subunit B
LIAEAVQKQLGLPVAMIEGDMVDESFYKDEIINSRVEAMLEAAESRLRRGITAYA